MIFTEMFGTGQHNRDMADDFARRGFAALIPNLYWRPGTAIMLACYVLGEHDSRPRRTDVTDYVCDDGRGFAVRGRFRDFASCADRATAGERRQAAMA